MENADTTVIRIDTDAGVCGWGECCPIGANYLPAYASGVCAGMAELMPILLGANPCAVGNINSTMDFHMLGHPYVKSAIDIACYDILGKSSGLPVHALLGGKQCEAMPMYRAVPTDSVDKLVIAIEKFREQGYKQFQLKVGADANADIRRIHAICELLQPGEILLCDANGAWNRIDARKVAVATRGLDYIFEQPCSDYEDCKQIRSCTTQSFKLDESLLSLKDLYRADRDGALDIACIKVSRFGGLTQSRMARDFCMTNGIAMTVEDCWGGEILSSAYAHLATSTPKNMLLNTTDLHNYNTVSLGKSQLQIENGCLFIGDEPGLGVEPDMERLGQLCAHYKL